MIDRLHAEMSERWKVDALIEDKGIAGNADVRQMIVPTSSWNAYFEKRQQRKIIIENIPALRICGTPINFAFEG